MEKTSHDPTPLEKYVNQGYREIARTLDEIWVILEDDQGGIIYDTQLEKKVGEYRFDSWGSMRKRKH